MTNDNLLTTRRELLHSTASATVLPVLSPPVNREGVDSPTANDMIVQASDLPWDFNPVEFPIAPTESPAYERLSETIPRLSDADMVARHYASTEIFGVSSPPPDITILVIITDGPAPDAETVDTVTQQWLTETYASNLRPRFDSEPSVQHSRWEKRWVYEHSLQDLLLRDVHTRQRVGDTLSLTNVRAYDSQYAAIQKAKQLNRQVRQRRLEWSMK